ncbi:MAG: desulfoferrodoxin family protein [Desulfobulbus sp.]|nr:desulfoferrodoxin family protein [Desulfobulbus sp.]
MQDRRDFLKTTALTASVLAVGSASRALATETASYLNIIYTKDNPGKWATKVGSHAPEVTISGSTVTVVTKHPMSNEHFIVRHTLVLADGTTVGAKTFTPTDKPESSYELPAGYKGKITATSFCNQHDFWLSEAMV